MKTENTPHKHASFMKRLKAFIIDVVIFTVSLNFLIYILESQFKISILKNVTQLQSQLISLGLFYIYDLGFLYFTTSTIGKSLMKIRIVNYKYQKPSLRQLLLRETIGRYISNVFFGLGSLWMLADPKNQTLHDRLSKTYVIEIDPKSQITKPK